MSSRYGYGVLRKWRLFAVVTSFLPHVESGKKRRWLAVAEPEGGHKAAPPLGSLSLPCKQTDKNMIPSPFPQTPRRHTSSSVSKHNVASPGRQRCRGGRAAAAVAEALAAAALVWFPLP